MVTRLQLYLVSSVSLVALCLLWGAALAVSRRLLLSCSARSPWELRDLVLSVLLSGDTEASTPPAL